MRLAIHRPLARLLLLAAPLAACAPDAPPPSAADTATTADSLKYGGTAVVAGPADLQPLNILTLADGTTAAFVRDLLYLPLVRYDARLQPQPGLAERWDTARVAPDTLELTFHLRRDVRWHDGRPVTAEDVRFTFERAVDPETAFPNASGFQFYSPRAVVVDSYTVKLRLRPHSDFLEMWYQTPPMPKHLLDSIPAARLATHPYGSQQAVGSGPFRLVRRVAGQEAVFAANPDFAPSLGGRPYLDRIVYRVVPDQTTLLTELLTGGVDVVPGINPRDAAQVKASPAATLVAAPFLQWVFIAWNSSRPQFDTPAERRAVAMAINRRQIVDALYFGYAEPGRATLTPSHWAFDAGDPATQLPHDTAAARRLLAGAGWADRDGDGVLEDAQGHDFRFTLKTNQGNDLRRDITEMVQAQLRPLGIAVEPRLVEYATLISQMEGEPRPGGGRARDFDAVVTAFQDFFRKDDADIVHSRNLGGPYQYAGYANPRVDWLVDTLALAVDRRAALPLWKEYQRLLVQESPYTVLYYPKRLTGLRKRLRGVDIDARGELSSAARWWIAPAER